MYFSIPEIEVAGFEPALDIMLSALPTELHPNLSIRSWGDDQICVNSQNHIDFPLYIYVRQPLPEHVLVFLVYREQGSLPIQTLLLLFTKVTQRLSPTKVKKVVTKPEWTFRDSNPRPTAYEAVALTN